MMALTEAQERTTKDATRINYSLERLEILDEGRLIRFREIQL